MPSPDNLFEKQSGLISTEKRIIGDKNFNSIIQGKKIDFNDDLIFNENEPLRNQNQNGNIIINNINNQNINYKQNISLSNKRIINRACISVQPLNNNASTLRQKCTCSKTGCLKKYCNCFANGVPCEGCECKNCQNVGNKNNNNIDLEEKKIFPVMQNRFERIQRTICNCTKSNCMKKYCECFKQGFSCNALCRCMDCKNKNIEEVNNINNNEIKNNNIPEFQDFSGSFFPNNENENENVNESNKIDFRLPSNYQTEAFGINVRKDQLKMVLRELDLNDAPLFNYGNSNELNATPKFSKRKRMRSKNESGNLKTCPTTNSSNKKGRSLSASVNKNIQKKKLNLN